MMMEPSQSLSSLLHPNVLCRKFLDYIQFATMGSRALREGAGAPEQGPWPLRAPGVSLELLESLN